MWRVMVLALTLAFTAGAGQSQEVLAGISITCDPAEVERVEFATLLADTSPWHGKCVEVGGYKGHRSLFVDADDTAAQGASSRDDLEGRRVGLYGAEETLERLGETASGEYIAVTGKVFDCRDLHGPDTIMVFGYCHYTGGPILIMGDFKKIRGPARLRRRPGQPE